MIVGVIAVSKKISNRRHHIKSYYKNKKNNLKPVLFTLKFNAQSFKHDIGEIVKNIKWLDKQIQQAIQGIKLNINQVGSSYSQDKVKQQMIINSFKRNKNDE